MEFEELGMQISVPFNQDPELIDEILQFKEHIHDVYLPCRPDIMGSGRWWQGGDPEGYDRLVEGIIEKLHKNDIQVNMLFNSICPELEGKTGKQIDYIEGMHEKGVDYVTVCSLLLAKRIRQEVPKLKISASTNAFINTVKKALSWREVCKVDDICIDRDINLRPLLIEKIKRTGRGASIRMLVNEGCLPDCAYRVPCMTYISHSDKEMQRDPFIKQCFEVREEDLWQEYSSSSIVPGVLKHYKGLVDHIKLQGRSYKTEIIMMMLDHYINNTESYHTDPDKTFEKPEEVFQMVSKCNRDCDACDWCKVYLKDNVLSKKGNKLTGILKRTRIA